MVNPPQVNRDAAQAGEAVEDHFDGLRAFMADLVARNDQGGQYDNGIKYAVRRISDFLDGTDCTQRPVADREAA